MRRATAPAAGARRRAADGQRVGAAFGTAEQSSQLRHDVPWAVFYAANWGQIIGDVAYFAPVDPPLLRHLWSLAVEEQWYLIWPFVFVALSWVGLRARQTACVLAGVAVDRVRDRVDRQASVGLGPQRINFLYLSTLTRSAGLLLGAAFAFAWRRWRHRPDRLLAGACSMPRPSPHSACSCACFVVGRVTATITYPWTMALVSVDVGGGGGARRAPGGGADEALARHATRWRRSVAAATGSTSGTGRCSWSWVRRRARSRASSLGLVIALVLSEACYRYVETPDPARRAERDVASAATGRDRRRRGSPRRLP